MSQTKGCIEEKKKVKSNLKFETKNSDQNDIRVYTHGSKKVDNDNIHWDTRVV